MKKFKLRKNQNIGALSAESDPLLKEAFVDTGFLKDFLNTSDPHFLILGRTGSGKTALIEKIKDDVEHSSILDPEELSMQYLHSNSILKLIMSWGIHLEIFFKYLWRHIIILELIKMRYGNETKSKSNIIERLFYGQELETEKLSLKYLEEHGDEYWITADTHIKNFTTDLESKIKNDSIVGAKLKAKFAELEANVNLGTDEGRKEHIEKEIIERTQRIVNDFQVAALNEVVKRLAQHGFNDSKKKYFLLIDDLDKNWMPNDDFYLQLIKTLLDTVREINHKLQGVKIIVALRTNIYYRVFQKTNHSEPQREKWLDVLYDIRWEKDELKNIINSRLGILFRELYTKTSPTIEDILPVSKKKNPITAFDYIINRTLMRPRDLIEFINLCIDYNKQNLGFNWAIITQVESEYSKNRLDALLDEWKDSFFGLPAVISILKKKETKFNWSNFTEEDIDSIFTYKDIEKSKWLMGLYSKFCNDEITYQDIKVRVINALFMTGIIGIKKFPNSCVEYSFDRPYRLFDFDISELENCTFYIHEMFWQSFNMQNDYV